MSCHDTWVAQVENITPLIRVVVSESGRREEIMCPKCREWQDVLAYKNPETIRVFRDSLNAIIKCMLCKHLFSPKWENS